MATFALLSVNDSFSNECFSYPNLMKRIGCFNPKSVPFLVPIFFSEYPQSQAKEKSCKLHLAHPDTISVHCKRNLII